MSWRKRPTRAGLHAVEHPNNATRRLYLEPPVPFDADDAPGAWFETWTATVREPGQPQTRDTVARLMPGCIDSPELLAVEYLRHDQLPVLTLAVLEDRDGSRIQHHGQLVESFETSQHVEGNRVRETKRWRLTGGHCVLHPAGRRDRKVYGVPIYKLEYLERVPVHKGPGPAERAAVERSATFLDLAAGKLEAEAQHEETDRVDALGRRRPRPAVARALRERAAYVRELAAGVRELQGEWEGPSGDGFGAIARRLP